ncbi:MAG TPA: Omp28 family outer membrane lipoprotein [Bacteroidia bacterium]|nr:Omp28 family outer membrane lipoprotein [Bacteroidia bacterium]HNU32814.1 Omp28 family outer membrane lipoprotein [Bacteroidia bacterium]
MKKIALSFISLALLVVGFISCDKVTDIYETPPEPVDSRRKILIEDFTGHKCGNCPRAARLIYDSLQNIYPEQIISYGVHAGFYARPLPLPGLGCDTVDYRCDAGNKWDTLFQVTAQGNPTGMVNRTDYNANNDQVKYASEWPSAVATLLQREAEAIIDIENTYNSSTRALTTTVKTDFLKSLSGTYKLVIVITEDNLVSCQKDDDATPVIVQDYVHRHVLRGAINGNYGEAIVLNPEEGDSESKTYSLVLNSSWVDVNCSVVAFVFNENTNEIVQVDEKKLTE